MALPIKECRKYILSICNKLKYFVNVLTPNPILVDCAAFVTEPGCYPQKWHRDTALNSENNKTSQNYANHISMGVMLEDVDDTLGPLEGLLGTNNLLSTDLCILLEKNNLLDKYYHEYDDIDDDHYGVGLYKDVINQLPKLDNKYKHVKCTCSKGSLVLWSSVVYHRGGQNYGNKDRPVFYITLMGDDGKNPMDFESTIEVSDKKIYIRDLL
jgi:ectoine hydroxylase-related dioxygenase (phytanoyl-CoA dioxygenase family)